MPSSFPGEAGRGQGGLPTTPTPSPHLQPPSGGSQALGFSFLNVEINFLQMTTRLSALSPSFPLLLKIHFPLLGLGLLPSSIRKYFCPPLFLGAVVRGRGPNWTRWGPRAGASPPWPQSSCLYSEASSLLSPTPPPFSIWFLAAPSRPRGPERGSVLGLAPLRAGLRCPR